MRNPNGYGSISKLSGNRRKPFIVRKTTGFTEEGKTTYAIIGYYETRKKAMMALAEYNKNPLDIDNSKITFTEIFEMWKKEKYTEKVSASTITGYNAAFKNSTYLHNLKMCEIKTTHLNQAILKCSKGFGSLRKMKILYRQLFQFAMTNDIVQKDYSQYVDIGKDDSSPIRVPFSLDEIKILVERVTSIDYIDSILVLIYTGLRISELLNLKKEDVNIEKEYFIVTESKTDAGRNRLVPINKKILPLINKRFTTGSNDYLFSHRKTNKKMSYEHYYREIFLDIMQRLDMVHRPHDARHTFATLLDNSEANKTAIKKMIGHSGFATLEKTYTHKDIEDLRTAINKI